MTGRRLWFVGIGGAGLSAYAQLARAWGAEVGGWDRVRTLYLEPLADVPIEISPEPHVPDGWEAVVSSAYPDVPGLRRREFLRDLVAARRSIAVAGSHGKGTTAALIAFVLRETGRDPAWLIGAPVPQLGSNAGFGSGFLVVEADESDRTVFALAPEIAVVTNLELDHHSEFASGAELEREFDEWLAGVPDVVRDAPPFEGELALPGSHNRSNAGAALAALELVGVSRDEAAPALARVTGTGRRVRVLFQPHLYSRTRHLAAEFAAALAAADDVTVTDIYPAREAPVPGVSGKLIVEALSDRGVLAGWTPTVDQGVARLDRRAHDGDVLLVLGAGDVDRAVGMLT